MRKKCGLALTLICALCMLVGCGKDDKLKLVTTESRVEESTPLDATDTDAKEKNNRQEASEEDKQVTLAQIDAANHGDVLLSSGYSYRLDTVYYEDGQEYAESQFLGFDKDGTYLQASTDIEGVVSILDKANGYWYLVDGGNIRIHLYPEPNVADAIINVNHNDFIVSLSETNQSITDIYREDGNLVVETSYVSGEDTFLFQYMLNDDLRVLEYRCLSQGGILLSKSVVVEDASFDIPKDIQEDQKLEEYRTVEVRLPETDELVNSYYVPKNRNLALEMLEYFAYTDKECTIYWDGSPSDEEGGYTDEVIYLRK